ncbi:hypothetical protein FO519_009714, partial [Halicephalobus sp. NKZ332]
AQEHVQAFLKSSGDTFSMRLSECDTIVYHEGLTNLPSFIRRRLMLAAMAGFDFVGISELTKTENEVDESTPESLQMIKECESISKYLRQCYGAGMPRPFDGRIAAVFVADEKIAHDVLDAVTLLGGTSFIVDVKGKIPVGVSHLIHDARELREKNSPCYHKINYNVFFKDLETEFDRLKLKSSE